MLASIFASRIRSRLVAPRLLAALISFGALALGGCKQDVGGRCEQNSDCASGICGDGQGGATSAMGRQCVATLGGPSVTPDASSTNPIDAAADVGADAVDAASSDAAGEVSSPDASEPGDAAGAEASPADGATDAESETESDRRRCLQLTPAG